MSDVDDPRLRREAIDNAMDDSDELIEMSEVR
jgi:hypothetical protein